MKYDKLKVSANKNKFKLFFCICVEFCLYRFGLEEILFFCVKNYLEPYFVAPNLVNIIPEFIIVHTVSTLPFLVLNPLMKEWNMPFVTAHCVSAMMTFSLPVMHVFQKRTTTTKTLENTAWNYNILVMFQ